MTWSGETFLAYLVDPRIVVGALTTIAVAAVAQIGATVVGFLLALALRARGGFVRAAATVYLFFFRGLPPLVLLLLFYFGLPQLGIRPGVLTAGLAGLTLYAGAYMAEVVRAALASVDAGQVEAARAMGLSRATTMRAIVLPQAMRVFLPPFGNEFTSMMRTTSLLSVISFEELLRVTTVAINETFRPLELYSVAAIYYLAMTTAWLFAQNALERRYALGAPRRRLAALVAEG